MRPDYYGGPDAPFEPRKVIRAWKLGFNLGNAVKYIARAGKKDPMKHLEDLEKARTYIEFEIEDLKTNTFAAQVAETFARMQKEDTARAFAVGKLENEKRTIHP